MAFLARFNVVAALRDLAQFVRNRHRHDYIAAAIALAVTGWIVFAFNHDSKMKIEPRITYVYNWPANRTDAEITSEAKADAAVRQKAVDARRDEYRQIADQLGIKY